MSVSDKGYRFGTVVKNSLVPDYRVMVIGPAPDSIPGYDFAAIVLTVPKNGVKGATGELIRAGGRIGSHFGDWWVVES